jgi:hypothetical protein
MYSYATAASWLSFGYSVIRNTIWILDLDNDSEYVNSEYVNSIGGQSGGHSIC